MNNVNANILELKDISLASYLYASGQVELVGKKRLPSGELYFQFSPKDTAETLINRYWNLQAPEIQPKTLFSALRDLKDIIFGG